MSLGGGECKAIVKLVRRNVWSFSFEFVQKKVPQQYRVYTYCDGGLKIWFTSDTHSQKQTMLRIIRVDNKLLVLCQLRAKKKRPDHRNLRGKHNIPGFGKECHVLVMLLAHMYLNSRLNTPIAFSGYGLKTAFIGFGVTNEK